jgi:hypothetical protein
MATTEPSSSQPKRSRPRRGQSASASAEPVPAAVDFIAVQQRRERLRAKLRRFHGRQAL